MDQDLEHLRLLAIFHRVVAALLALFGCFPLIHLTIGLGVLSGELHGDRHDVVPLAVVGWLFVVIAVLVIGAMWTMAACVLVAARNLEARRRHTYCLVVACVLCTFVPFGTVLGVFTILVLSRPSVRTLFGLAPAAPPMP